LNKIVILIFLVIIISLFSGPSLINAEIKATPPLNWQPDPLNNNYDVMVWHQNSTKSTLWINKAPSNTNQSFPMFSFPLALIGPLAAQSFADKGVLESTDQITFGHSNYGYRYFLNISDPLKLANSSDFTHEGNVADMILKGYNVPLKGMLIFTEKQGDLYAIVLMSPRENFDQILNEIKPTIDSIQLTNSTGSP
jgi:hypothetical protein